MEAKTPTKWIVAIGQLHGRCMYQRKVAGNTWLKRRAGNEADGYAVALQYHDTDVVTFRPDGGMVLNSGGWHTVTTKERINWCLPDGFRLSQVKRVWYITVGETTQIFSHPITACYVGNEHVFADGMVVYPDGRVEGAGKSQQKGMQAKHDLLKENLEGMGLALNVSPSIGGDAGLNTQTAVLT